MKFKTMTMRIMATVLPVVVLVTISLTAISYITSSRIITAETTTKMMAILDTELEKIQSQLDKNAAIAQSLVCYAESATTEDFESGKYKEFMYRVIPTNPDTMGGGIWFEPYKMKSDLHYFGPYVYMEGGIPVFTDIYSNADYDYLNMDWYKNGKSSKGDIVWTDVYYDHVAKATLLVGSQPFYDGKKQFLGATTAEMDVTNIQRVVRDVKVGKTGKLLLIGANGAYISCWDDTKTTEMIITDDQDSDLAALGDLIQSHESGTASFVKNKVKHQVYYRAMPKTGWRLAIVAEDAELSSAIRGMAGIMLVVTLVSLLMMVLVIISLTKYLRNNLGKIGDFSKIAASGNFANRLTVDTKDEFDAIAGHLNSMMEDLDRMSRESTQMLEESAKMVDENTKMLEKSRRLINKIEKSAADVSSVSKQIADGAQTMAQGSTEQASAVEELSASMNEISEKTAQNAKIAQDAADMLNVIKHSAEKGSVEMGHMVQTVEDINEASSNIEKAIKVIDDIAFQTNILALNAAVEAAKAGQHGKGFSVVAEEIRNLAAKSAEVAKETGELIDDSVEKANLGLNIATETSASLGEIVKGINRSAEIAAQIARLSDEQATAISQVNTGIDQVTQVVLQNSATAEESAAASEEMSGQAEMLNNLVKRYGDDEDIE